METPLEEIVQFLRLATWNAYMNAMPLGGSGIPRVDRYVARSEDLRVGDMVTEISTIAIPNMDSIGFFIETKEEWIPFPEEEGGYHEKFTYIKNLDGKVKRWSNCRFIVVPTKVDFLDQWRKS